MHTDTARAADGPYERTIAHGYMLLSWGIPMFGELLKVTGAGRALNYGVDRVRYPAPAPVGSRVRPHASVAEVEEVARGGVRMTRAFTFELEGSVRPARVAQALTHFCP
ncbi:MaoC family dehydratase [Streptomyces sp. MBT51]|nr:MaoC/PaaZ C-terminal domain-containing protein [Streptomyces sp. MBT51]MBK3594705.1 MaoC family dehydratase [Streptomyces sp. MBT51]